VLLDSFWRRLLCAWLEFDVGILVSDYIGPESRIQFRRAVQERIGELAPFLELDADPYLVIDDGHLFWIQDAYTVASGYPYAEPTEDGIGYNRDSVKVVVDAFNGGVTFYVIDPADPCSALTSRSTLCVATAATNSRASGGASPKTTLSAASRVGSMASLSPSLTMMRFSCGMSFSSACR
jgi:hypothetical protein